VEDPGKLGVLGDTALVEDDVPLRVNAGSQERRRDRPCLPGQVVVDERGRQRMQIDDAVKAVVAVLQRHELAQRAEIIAKVQVACGLHPRKDEWFERSGHEKLRGLWRASWRMRRVSAG